MDVERQILLCIQSLSLPELVPALEELRQHPSERAQLAVALLHLEHARRGSQESKDKLPEVAGLLLRTWREGKPHALLQGDATLTKLWEDAVVLLRLFEAKRLSKQLNDCWDAREDVPRLKAAVAALSPAGHRRVEFAICLYSFELARLGVAEAQGEFHKRVLCLKEAFFSPDLAAQLQGGNIGLSLLWKKMLPVLTQYFSQAASQSQEILAPVLSPPPAPQPPDTFQATDEAALLPTDGAAFQAADEAADEAALLMEFWRHAEAHLGLFPAPAHAYKAVRAFSAESPEGQEQLLRYIAETRNAFDALPMARAFLSSLHLLLAANHEGPQQQAFLQAALEYFPQQESLLTPVTQLLVEGDALTQQQLLEGWWRLLHYVHRCCASMSGEAVADAPAPGLHAPGAFAPDAYAADADAYAAAADADAYALDHASHMPGVHIPGAEHGADGPAFK